MLKTLNSLEQSTCSIQATVTGISKDNTKFKELQSCETGSPSTTRNSNKLLDKVTCEIQEAWHELDALEQNTHKNSTEIHKISENLYTNPGNVAIKVDRVINVNKKPEDTYILHKLHRLVIQTRQTIVKFSSHKMRERHFKVWPFIQLLYKESNYPIPGCKTMADY